AMRAGTAESRRRIATVLVESRWDNKLIRPALLTALKDTDSRVRQVAAHGLGMREDRDAIPALIRVVQTDGDRSVRAEAIGSLAFFTSEARSAVPTLLEVLEKEAAATAVREQYLGRQAAAAVVTIAQQEAVRPLLALVEQPKKGHDVRSLALWSLQ